MMDKQTREERPKGCDPGRRSRLLSIDGSGDWSGRYRLLLRFSLLLLFLLLLHSFVQAHLWKHRPFRAIDTDHSGGDHICNLRRDNDGDGAPDRLGDCVSVSGTVIAEPSTYETGGWIFWIRQPGCGVMVYGEQETLLLCDSVRVRGWLRLTNADYFFPETGLATQGDIAVENGGVTLIGRSYDREPLAVTAARFCSDPAAYGGNLISLDHIIVTAAACSVGSDRYVNLRNGADTLVAYIDGDTGCQADIEAYTWLSMTGIVTRMKLPPGFAHSPAWCIAPRCDDDIVITNSHTTVSEMPWGKVKSCFGNDQ